MWQCGEWKFILGGDLGEVVMWGELDSGQLVMVNVHEGQEEIEIILHGGWLSDVLPPEMCGWYG